MTFLTLTTKMRHSSYSAGGTEHVMKMGHKLAEIEGALNGMSGVGPAPPAAAPGLETYGFLKKTDLVAIESAVLGSRRHRHRR